MISLKTFLCGLLLLISVSQMKTATVKQDGTFVRVPNVDKENNNNCGVPWVDPEWSNAHIVGGEEAKNNSWPWQVGLLRSSRNRTHFCGGSILSEEWVVTAAHCVSRVNESEVVAGRQKLGEFESTTQTAGVSEVVVHPEFDYNTSPDGQMSILNDIALLRLNPRLNFTKYVRKVCFPSRDADAGDECIATGWGLMNFIKDENSGNVTPVLPTYLRQIKLPIVDQTVCKEMYKRHNFTLLETEVCAGEPGLEGCYGDSGGPLVHKRGGRYELYGVVSHGVGDIFCGVFGGETPTVFARVYKYVDWIKQTTGLN